MERPEYVKCIADPHERKKSNSLCGRLLQNGFGEWAFTGLDHAFLTARSNGRLLICHDCAKEAIAQLTAGTADP